MTVPITHADERHCTGAEPRTLPLSNLVGRTCIIAQYLSPLELQFPNLKWLWPCDRKTICVGDPLPLANGLRTALEPKATDTHTHIPSTKIGQLAPRAPKEFAGRATKKLLHIGTLIATNLASRRRAFQHTIHFRALQASPAIKNL